MLDRMLVALRLIVFFIFDLYLRVYSCCLTSEFMPASEPAVPSRVGSCSELECGSLPDLALALKHYPIKVFK